MSVHMSQKDDSSPQDVIREAALAFQRSRILLTGYELDLFTALGDEGRCARDIAQRLGIDERAADRLMNALSALGLLRKKEGTFFNTPLTSQYLVKGKGDYMAGLMHAVHLWDTWGTLTEAVRRGTSVTAKHINERGETWLSAFIAAMHERARKHAPAVAGMLDLGGVSRVLDVGGGSGAFAMSFVRARRGITATVFDLPNVARLTQHHIENEGLSESIETIAGDYNCDDLGEGYDMVFLSAIIHSNSPKENGELPKKCSRALNPAGQVVVQDFIVDEDRTTPAFAALFGLNMLVATESGDTYTESEVRTWMKEAGLLNIARKDTDFGTTLIIGRKNG